MRITSFDEIKERFDEVIKGVAEEPLSTGHFEFAVDDNYYYSIVVGIPEDVWMENGLEDNYKDQKPEDIMPYIYGKVAVIKRNSAMFEYDMDYVMPTMPGGYVMDTETAIGDKKSQEWLLEQAVWVRDNLYGKINDNYEFDICFDTEPLKEEMQPVLMKMLKDNVISIGYDGYACDGIHCKFEDNEFYFGGNSPEQYESVEEFREDYDDYDIATELADTIVVSFEEDMEDPEWQNYIMDVCYFAEKWGMKHSEMDTYCEYIHNYLICEKEEQER